MRKKITFYFVLTFVITWGLWLPFVLEGMNIIKLPQGMSKAYMVFMILGAFGPFIASLILIGKASGLVGIKGHMKGMFSFKIKISHGLVAVAIPLIITMGVHYGAIWSGLDQLPETFIPDTGRLPRILLLVPYFLMMMLLGGGQEELGWRGYAQDILVAKLGLLKANLTLGILWGLWHLPLWFIPSDGHSHYAFVVFMGLTLGMSMILGVLHEISKGSVLIAVIFHGMSNAAVPFFPVLHMAAVPQPGYGLWVATYLLVGGLFMVYYYKRVVPLKAGIEVDSRQIL